MPDGMLGLVPGPAMGDGSAFSEMVFTFRSGSSRILRLSLRSFCSSSVSNDPSSTNVPASGKTLNAIVRANFVGCGNETA